MGHPALVIMAKQPAVGQTKTRLCPPLTPHQAAALYEALLWDTVERVADLEGVDLVIAVTPPEAAPYFRRLAPRETLILPVSGVDIGDCLRQVLGSLLSAGHVPALALNSDGPTLPLGYLEQALAWLSDADVVLGPSEDGGYYLIGMSRPHPGLFHKIPWSTPQVTPQTLVRAEAMGLSVALLPSWYDVDTPADLERLQAELEALPDHVLPHTRRVLAERGV